MRRASEPYSSVRTTEAPVPDEVHVRSSEPRAERSSIATFFGFGPKPEPSKAEAPVRSETPATPAPAPEPAPQPAAPVETEASDAPKKRGWWQKRSDS
jgi:hypothetical protein